MSSVRHYDMSGPIIRNILILTFGLAILTFQTSQVSGSIEDDGGGGYEVSVGDRSYNIKYRAEGLNVNGIEYNGYAVMSIEVENSGEEAGMLELELPNEFVTIALTGLPPIVNKLEDEIDPDTVPGGMGIFAHGQNVDTVAESNIVSSGCTENTVLEIVVPSGSDTIIIDNTNALLGISPTLDLSIDRCMHKEGEPITMKISYNNSYPENATVDLSVTSVGGKVVYQTTTEMEPNSSVNVMFEAAEPGLLLAEARVGSSNLTAQENFIIEGSPLALPINIQENQYDILIEGDHVVTGLVFSRIGKTLYFSTGNSESETGAMAISVPSVLLGGNVSVVGSENTEDLNFAIIESNSTHNVIRVEYTRLQHGPGSLAVTGTTTIPEFSIGLVAFIVATTMGAIVALNRTQFLKHYKLNAKKKDERAA